MAILNQKRILNLIPKVSAPVTIHVSQGDVGTVIEFTLVKGDEVFSDTGNLSASVHGVREDGANFGPFTCTLSGSKVTFPLHSEMTAVKGSALAEIVLVDNGGNKVGSANFGILVEESVFPLGVTYDNDVSVYESILAYVQTIPAQLTNDYTAKINAVQSNLNNEITTRTSADALINTRIDEIIAPTGEAPSAAEVTDARIGANGVTYQSLGKAIRTQIQAINDDAIINRKKIPTNTDLNDIMDNSVREGVGGLTYLNAPVSGSFILQTIVVEKASNYTLIKQIATAFSAANDFKYVRLRLVNGTWTDWVSYTYLPDNTFINKYKVATNTDLDTIIDNSVRVCIGGLTYLNAPVSGSFLLETIVVEKTASYTLVTQIARALANSGGFIRYRMVDGTWTDWHILEAWGDTRYKYYAFGDSIVYGEIGGDNSNRTKNTYAAIASQLMRMPVNNQGVRGQGLIKDWDTINTNYIQNLDMTDAKVITVGWAYNDGSRYPSMPFGSYTDTNDTSYIGKHFTIMKRFQEKCPTALVILVTGYGYPDGRVGPPVVKPTLTEQFSHLYTFSDRQITMGDMYNELEKMCKLHGWNCINQANGTVFNEYNVNDVIGDQVHPNENGYTLYGNFLGAKIASLYGNVKLP